MSTWYAQDLACDRCGHRFSATLARGIHARRLPEVRDQIIAGQLHRLRCEACNADIVIAREVAYTDFVRYQWVQVATPAQLATWSTIERDALARFDHAMTNGAPIVATLIPKFVVRLVFDLDELREKLVIWDAGLDDAVIECAKLVALRDRPSLARPDHRLRLRAVDDTLATFAIVARDQPFRDVATWRMERAALARLAADRETWRATSPELFARGFVSLDRYLVPG